MTGELTPPDPQPNSDETYCVNCESIVDKLQIGITADFDNGCSECMKRCVWCGKYYFSKDMYLCTYFGRICNECISADAYKKAVRSIILKEALRCYFDTTEHKGIEQKIIEVTQAMGFDKLAKEMRNDIK